MDENPYKAPREGNRKSRIWLVIFVVGILLTLAPIFGVLPTVWGMIAAMNQEQPRPDDLAEQVNLGLILSAAGLLICPLGLALAVISGIKLNRRNRSA